MLSFAEEIYLLSLDDVSGKLTIPSNELGSALIGALLGELSFMGKIDTDTEYLYLIKKDPTGHEILDETIKYLEKICTDGSGEHPKATIYEALRALLPESEKIEKLTLEELIEKKILKKVEEKILWIFPSRRYPIINNKEIKDVESRLRDLVLGDDIPDPRETVLISLVNACGLFEQILSPKELKRSLDKITSLSKMDSVGQEVANLINQIIAMASIPPYI